MKRTILLLLAILLWGGTSLLHAQAEAPFLPSAADARCKQWVDSVFSGLNLQEKVGQLIVTTFPAKADKQKKKQIRDLVKKYKIGGLLFAEGTPEEQAILTNIAQKNSKVPVMITFDGEWGLSMRLEGTPYFPKNAALGCIEDNQLIYEYGREVAREFRELGVHVNFAPDADVNTNPLNPVIHVRSFGEDPKKVAEKVLAYSRGLESGGVLSVSKHFPGHGDTDVDSHKGLPVLYYNRERLDSVELYPFREMVRAGLGGVMVGHLQVPALEPDAKTASSLSRNVVTGLLKDEMGFQGLVFTDALDMKGVSSVPQLTTKALLAGNDMVLVQYNTANAVQEVLSAVKEGVLSEKEVEDVIAAISSNGGTPLVVCVNRQVAGVIELQDIIKPGIQERFERLRKMGVKTVMVTGDNPLTAKYIAEKAGVDDFIAEAKPEDKMEYIKKEQQSGKLVAMMGDGTNDAPALAQANVGVAMNSGTQAAKEAGNMVDLDNDPTKLIEIVEIGKQLLMTRGTLTTFSIANDVAKYFAIIPALFMVAIPQLAPLNIMGLHSPESAILSAIIFNAIIIPILIPLALKGVQYKPIGASALLRRNLLIYGLGGVIAPFIGIKLIDMIVSLFFQ